MMTPDDVPLHFSRETIVVALTTVTFAYVVFDDRDDDEYVLGQLFAIYVGTRLSDGPDDPVQARDAFVEWMRGHAPDGSLARFASADAAHLDNWYRHVLRDAAEHSVDLRELRPALMSIDAVLLFFEKSQDTNVQDPGN
jgi:hypothetical protein